MQIFHQWLSHFIHVCCKSAFGVNWCRSSGPYYGKTISVLKCNCAKRLRYSELVLIHWIHTTDFREVTHLLKMTYILNSIAHCWNREEFNYKNDFVSNLLYKTKKNVWFRGNEFCRWKCFDCKICSCSIITLKEEEYKKHLNTNPTTMIFYFRPHILHINRAKIQELSAL